VLVSGPALQDFLDFTDEAQAGSGVPAVTNATAFGNVMLAEWKIRRAGGDPLKDIGATR
jgi:hypothetical protein